VLVSKRVFNPEATPTNPNVAQSAVRHEKQNAMAAVATAMETEIPAVIHLTARCIQQYVPNVASPLQYLSSPARADRYIAVIAIAK
jgi:hypothetical protein